MSHRCVQAAAELKCMGSEWSVEECSWSVPGGACSDHTRDTIVYCFNAERATAPQGATRLISSDGSPSVDGKGRPEIYLRQTWFPICVSGISQGSAAVLCKSMGFAGASGSGRCNGKECGTVPPGVSEMACSGTESTPLACPHEYGDDVFCSP